MIRNRITELRHVTAGGLRADPRNWRQHPPAQQSAMRGVLEEIGYADALLAREDADGTLVLVDGHLRAGLDSEQEVPVLILDVDEHEGDVYEPFCGSGTTMVAAEQLGRTCYSLEIEPKYVAVTLERMAGMGLTPELTHDAA